MRLILSILLLLLFQVCSAQIILTEVMFDADTLENYNEFIEIYNNGTVHIDLNGWLVGDSAEQDLLLDAGNGLLLQPQQYGLILDPGYFENSTIYDGLIPPGALVLTIEDASFGSFGLSNSNAEPVILINSTGDTVQRYVYSLNNDPGYSDEKIILSPDNSPGNWGNSLSFRGTPGDKNSISPKEIDLSLEEFHFITENFLVGESPAFEVVVKNPGQQTVVQFQFHTFIDLND
ncbi:MAG: lamin tail domain-containing protein, partial [Calditrichia bacterium]